MATKNTELSKAFQERQAAERTLFQAQTRLSQNESLKRHTELALVDIGALPEDTVAYRTVGRLFVRDSIPSITEELNGIIASSTAEITSLKSSVPVLTNNFQQADKAVRELSALDTKE